MKQRSRLKAAGLRNSVWTCVRREILLVPLVPALTACAPIAAMVGMAQPTVQVATQVDQMKIMADGVAVVASGKSVADHVLSVATGSDCMIVNVVSGTPVCVSVCR